MRITVIYGTMRQGSTYNITKLFLENLCTDKSEITEFFLPRDCPNFCRGCFKCFEDNTKCPDYSYIEPIIKALDNADLIILSSPVYVYHVTGAMKSFLDHLAFRAIVHKPSEIMFKKQAIAISTAAGDGCKKTNNDMLDSFFFWGVGKTYTYGANVFASSWKEVSDEKKVKIKKEVFTLSKRIEKNSKKKIVPSLKLINFFNICRILHKRGSFSESDTKYWREKGWLDNKRPWK
ncbi:MAG: flavodoxin family protein [Sarcina sp.]